MKGTCVYCKKTFTPKSSGQYHRSVRLGLNVFCGRKCFGLSRRINLSKKELVEIKAWYDSFIRVSMEEEDIDLDYLQNAVYFQMDYAANPDKYKEVRRLKMPYHVEYCRQPEYRRNKKEYDEKYHAKKKYGEYWEAAILLNKLENEIDNRTARKENKLFQKSSGKRKRLWQRLQNQSNRNLQPLT